MLVFVGSTILFILLSSRWTEVSLKVVRREVDSAVHKSKVLKGDCVINENCNVWVIALKLQHGGVEGLGTKLVTCISVVQAFGTE